MPDGLEIQYQARYRRMEDGTKDEYLQVFQLLKKFELGLADRVLSALQLLKNSYPGETVNRYVHSLQTATRAHRDGRDEEYVVAALLHDLGDMLASENHSEYAASIIKPYVRPHTYWMIRQHGLFQGYYYFHHFGVDRNAREKHRGHPAYELCLDFCAKYDQMAFDPDYDTMPLEAFEPMVRHLFAREPWGAHAKEQGGYAERF
jgi:predicted HD phosphohydrolase